MPSKLGALPHLAKSKNVPSPLKLHPRNHFAPTRDSRRELRMVKRCTRAHPSRTPAYTPPFAPYLAPSRIGIGYSAAKSGPASSTKRLLRNSVSPNETPPYNRYPTIVAPVPRRKAWAPWRNKKATMGGAAAEGELWSVEPVQSHPRRQQWELATSE